MIRSEIVFELFGIACLIAIWAGWWIALPA
jgi:hypothetical protein